MNTVRCTLYDVKTKQRKVENDVSLEYYFELHLYLTFLKIKKRSNIT